MDLTPVEVTKLLRRVMALASALVDVDPDGLVANVMQALRAANVIVDDEEEVALLRLTILATWEILMGAAVTSAAVNA